MTIGDTVSDPLVRRAMPRVTVDEPTIQMVFSINSSPFVGRDRELAELAAFGAGPGEAGYLWWRGPAWAGISCSISE